MEQLSQPKVIRSLLERHHVTMSKGLGQNFLINPSVCPRIALEGVPSREMGVLEIGPGIGVLTQALSQVAKNVVAVELDHRLLPVLAETVGSYQNVTVVQGDILELDLKALIQTHFAGMELCVCANLPYYITTPILMRLLEGKFPLKQITVMVQKEVAVRLSAPLGSRECGAITFAVRYYSEPRVLFSVSRGSFLPAPHVDSAVMQFTPHPPDHAPPTVDEPFLFSIVKAGFSQRRKKLLNPLSSELSLEKERVADALDQCGLSASIRAEAMRFSDWIALANTLKEDVSSKGAP